MCPIRFSPLPMIALRRHAAEIAGFVGLLCCFLFCHIYALKGMFLYWFLTYFLVEKQWKVIPLVLVGTIFFCVTGYPYHHDWLWVFSKNYGDASNIYGHGEITHFVANSRWINGPILTIILGFSLFMVVFNFKKLYTSQLPFLMLVMGCYFGFFVLHSFLWWKGLGASLD